MSGVEMKSKNVWKTDELKVFRIEPQMSVPLLGFAFDGSLLKATDSRIESLDSFKCV